MDWDSMQPFFRIDEFRCTHCGEARMDSAFMRALYDLRLRVGIPLIVSSGYRCPVHNSLVSSTGANGPHTTGRASDIRIHGAAAYELLRVAFHMPQFTGIGISQKGALESRFIHLDTLPSDTYPRPRVWSY